MQKMLTPSELAKLPSCKYTNLGKCDKAEYPKVDAKHCVMCTYLNIFNALTRENLAEATYGLTVMMKILKEMDAIPKDANP